VNNLKQKPKGGWGAQIEKTPAAKYLYWSIFKKSRHLGFGVFIDIWSMGGNIFSTLSINCKALM